MLATALLAFSEPIPSTQKRIGCYNFANYRHQVLESRVGKLCRVFTYELNELSCTITLVRYSSLRLNQRFPQANYLLLFRIKES